LCNTPVGVNSGEFVGWIKVGGTVTNCYANTELILTGQYGSLLYDLCNITDSNAIVKNCFTTKKLEKSKATSSGYIYGTLGWDREIWEVVEGEYPKLRVLNKK
ncbi:MAG: hypothetical protein IKB23_05780, partial [Clostridia bacterium]|nr:hypothetical protein [Clostridia bacterium]